MTMVSERNLCWRLLGGGALVALALVAGACSSTSDDASTGSETPSENTSPAGSVIEDSTEDPASPGAESSEAPEEENTGAAEEDDADAPLYATDPEDLVALDLGDVLGATRPEGETPSSFVETGYSSLCPRTLVEVSVLRQADPLIGGIPLTRFIILFASSDEASAFFETEAGTAVGCVAVNETESSTGTTTVESVERSTIDGADALTLVATTSVKIEGLDQATQPVAIRRLIAVEDNAVVVAVGFDNYESVLGREVFEPLVIDGLEVVRNTAGS